MRRRANGEGSIRQRSDGRWEGRYAAGYDILTGKRITKSVYAQTKTECAAKLARAISENSAPYYRAGIGYENRPLADWCRFWFETYCKPSLRPNSVNSYTRVLEKHIIPFLGGIKLSRLSSMQVQQMCHELKERGRLNQDGTRANKPLSAAYVRHIHGVLKSCLQQAVADRIIPFNPCENSRLPRRQKKKMVILPLEKISAYLQTAEQMGVYPLFFLELTSGLRRGELLALLWSDLDVNTRTLKINKQITRTRNGPVVAEPKTPNAVRTVVLPQQTVDALIEEHNRHPDSPLMFCSPRTNGYWEPNSVDYLHKRILAAAGIYEPVRFHDLRHTFATIAVQNGVDVKTVSNMLGHHSAAFTLDAYTHVTEEMQRGAAEKISDYINANIQDK
jgi:integrase